MMAADVLVMVEEVILSLHSSASIMVSERQNFITVILMIQTIHVYIYFFASERNCKPLQ